MPASGKTTFAAHLGQELGWPVFSKDYIKELLYDNLGFRGREEKSVLGKTAADILYYYAESLMGAGQPFILEDNFENVSKPRLKQLLEAYGYQPVTVLFGGDVRAIYQRFLDREHSGLRHKGHLADSSYPPPSEAGILMAPLSMEEFLMGVERRGIRDFSVGGLEIFVDATSFEQVQYAAIVAQIREALRGVL